MSTVYNDGFFIWTNYNGAYAALGDANRIEENGNGFVSGTAVSGDIEIPRTTNNIRVESILHYVFRECKGITSLKLPNTLKRLEHCSLTTLASVKEIIIPASIEYFGRCIDYFSIATRFIFEEGSKLNSIGNYFLRYSPKIEEVILPPSIKSIGNYICDHCTSLKCIMFCGKSDMSSIAEAFKNCPSFQRVIVTKYYKGTSFGGFSPWVNNLFICKTKIATCKRCDRTIQGIFIYLMTATLV